jgi:polysaccharide deacetylase 2 family uncharacterized protein YibQ
MTRVDGDDGAEHVPGLQPEEALGPRGAQAPRPTAPDRAADARDTPPRPVPTEPESPVPGRPAPVVDGPPPPGDGAAVALVIDDLGRSLEDVTRLAALDVPITYAVLPFESRTAEVASELRRLGVEWILHLPMEPSTGADPGPGALRRSMSPRELAGATRAALDAVPGAMGVNNHMGSSLSADRPSMDAVLREIRRRGLYFLDSRTSAESVGYRAARDLEIPAAERQVFLDPDPRAEAVRYQFRRLLAVARERGAAIAIGHPHAETLRVLEEEIPLARARGYRFVPVSYLLDSTAVAAR